MATYYTIDPHQFTASQWEELYNTGLLMPRSLERHYSARSFKRQRYQIEHTVGALYARAEYIRETDGLGEYTDAENWACDLEGAADVLLALIERFEFCPKCGKRVARGAAFIDHGEGPEAGRTFYYCSEHCRETH